MNKVIIAFCLFGLLQLQTIHAQSDDSSSSSTPSEYCCECKPCPNNETTILESPRVTDRGDWGEWAWCRNGTFVKALRLQIETYNGLDDTGVNAVELFCGLHGIVNIKNLTRILSLAGPRGRLGEMRICKEGELAIGFELRSEVEQAGQSSTALNVDNVGAVALRLICSGSHREVIEDSAAWESFGFNHWTGPQLCPDGKAICGFRTQVQPDQGAIGDDTALNNIDMACCDTSGRPTGMENTITCICRPAAANNSVAVPCTNRIDLVIVFCVGNTPQDIALQKTFALNLAEAFQGLGRVGFVLYAGRNTVSPVTLESNLQFDEISRIIQGASLGHGGGGEGSVHGITSAVQQFRSSGQGFSRKSVVMTDNPASNRALSMAASSAQANNIELYALGISNADDRDLMAIAGGNVNNIYRASTFEALLELIRPVSVNICQD